MTVAHFILENSNVVVFAGRLHSLAFWTTRKLQRHFTRLTEQSSVDVGCSSALRNRPSWLKQNTRDGMKTIVLMSQWPPADGTLVATERICCDTLKWVVVFT